MISVTNKGSFRNTLGFLKRAKDPNYMSILSRFGEIGKAALADATPKDSGDTAISWSYKVEKTNSGYQVSWHNSHMAGSVPVAILIQYGHATKNGGYVTGKDFINPALAPVFDQLAEAAWKEIKKS